MRIVVGIDKLRQQPIEFLRGIVNQILGFKYLHPIRIVVGHMHQQIKFGKNSLNSNFFFSEHFFNDFAVLNNR